jgi:nodulation protein E
MRVGAQVPDYDPARFFSPEELPLLDLFSQFAVIAAREAVADARLEPHQLRAAAAVIGTGCGGKVTDEETYQRLYQQGRTRVHPLTIPKGMPSAAASQVSMQLGIQGPVFSVVSACASAAHAICQAVAMIRGGLVQVGLAGGTDAPFTFGLIKAWEAMRVLADDTCRPFSGGRHGTVLGEGAGIVVLESLGHAQRRGAQIYAVLAGCGMSADAGHITDPSAEGPAAAMRSALEDASLAPDEVDYVNAHGTGTEGNDVTETLALRRVFGANADRLAVSSTKSMHGHALGASGGIELVATVLALRYGIIPPTANFLECGPGCDLDYVPNRARRQDIRAAISNSFAFGGLNAVLAVRCHT